MRGSGQKKPGGEKKSRDEMDRIVARARQALEERMTGYREQSLRIHPWVCARCGREFTVKNLHLLTVHHRDHNHENNPSDGSNWKTSASIATITSTGGFWTMRLAPVPGRVRTRGSLPLTSPLQSWRSC